jgi:hypothetical protein
MSIATTIQSIFEPSDPCSRLFGPYITVDEVEEVLDVGRQMARNVGTRRLPRFQATESGLKAVGRPAVNDTIVVGIDIGSRGIRAATRSVSTEGRLRWHGIFDETAACLARVVDPHGGLTGIAHFVAASTERTIADLGKLDGLAIVWSNSLRVRALLDSCGVRGVTATTQMGRHDYFGSNEWWASNLTDGDDIGGPFLEAFRARGMTPRSFVIGNDAVFVARALVEPPADSGVVVSSGANTTVIAVGGRELRNAQSSGIRVARPPRSPDRLGCGEVTVGGLTSNSGVLPRFVSYVESAAREGQKDLSTFAEQLGDGTVTVSRDLLAALARGEVAALTGLGWGAARVPACTLAIGLIRRAALLSGCLAYLSIFNQIDNHNRFEIALDSSQARFFPDFLPVMQQSLSSLIGNGRVAVTRLLYPLAICGVEVSVPMQGAVNAASAYLDPRSPREREDDGGRS